MIGRSPYPTRQTGRKEFPRLDRGGEENIVHRQRGIFERLTKRLFALSGQPVPVDTGVAGEEHRQCPGLDSRFHAQRVPWATEATGTIKTTMSSICIVPEASILM